MPEIRMIAAMIAVVGSLVSSAAAQGYNDVLKPGDPAPAWVDLPGVDGKTHSLADLADKDVVVVVFTCVSCPAAEDYEERIAKFAAQHAGPESKVAVVAINVNATPEDGLPQMKERAKERGYRYPYLYDETQKIAKRYGATYTPEFFVLDKGRSIVYLGAFDDRDDPAKASRRFVEEAVAAALAGRVPETRETLARGCRIRWARAKKGR